VLLALLFVWWRRKAVRRAREQTRRAAIGMSMHPRSSGSPVDALLKDEHQSSPLSTSGVTQFNVTKADCKDLDEDLVPTDGEVKYNQGELIYYDTGKLQLSDRLERRAAKSDGSPLATATGSNSAAIEQGLKDNDSQSLPPPQYVE
jgi:hypothetical protein